MFFEHRFPKLWIVALSVLLSVVPWTAPGSAATCGGAHPASALVPSSVGASSLDSKGAEASADESKAAESKAAEAKGPDSEVRCPPGSPRRAHAEVVDPFWVPLRLQVQQSLGKNYRTFHGFRFRDEIVASGITFEHQIVEDAGRNYKAVHYDHGNGIAAADVDGDGRLDLYFTTQLGPNELWRNAGNGRFEPMKSAGVAVEDRVSVTASFGDIDNDGDPDLFVTTVRGGNLLFENDGKGNFRDISKAAGVDHVGHSSGAVFFDYDRDGLLDLFVTNVGKYTSEEKGPGPYWIGYADAFSGHLFPERTEASVLYRNLGKNRFEDVSEKTGLVETGWNGDATAVDLNEDGWLDLYVLNMQGHDEYWQNVDGKRFERKGREIFPSTPWGTMGVRIADYDNDGDMDIYLTDMHTDMIEVLPVPKEKSKMPKNRPKAALATDGNHVLGNAFFRNDGKGRFTEVSDALGAENFWPWGLSSGDLNADGWEDVFITSSMNYPWRYGINSLLLNEGGKGFADSEYLVGVEPRKGGATAKPWFDLDCSGADAGHVDCQDQTGCVTVMGALGTRSSVLFDLEGDGDVDIVTNEFNAEPMVLQSNLSTVRPVRWIEVDLEGKRSNRSGLGARITVKAGGRTFVKVNDGKSGYLSQSDMPIYFGLGEATSVERIEVLWPSGIRQTVEAPEIGSRITIEEAVPKEKPAS